MKTRLIRRKPVAVLSAGLTRFTDLNDLDAVLIVNPDKFEPPANGEPFEVVITFGEPNDQDTPA